MERSWKSFTDKSKTCCCLPVTKSLPHRSKKLQSHEHHPLSNINSTIITTRYHHCPLLEYKNSQLSTLRRFSILSACFLFHSFCILFIYLLLFFFVVEGGGKNYNNNNNNKTNNKKALRFVRYFEKGLFAKTLLRRCLVVSLKGVCSRPFVCFDLSLFFFFFSSMLAVNFALKFSRTCFKTSKTVL